MTITGIRYRHTMFNNSSDRVSEADIPFTGEDPVITQIIRSSYETCNRSFPMTGETAGQYLSLIEEYKITDWIGKTPASPEVYNDESLHSSSELTLIFDDGSKALITFRETSPETGKEAAGRFSKLLFSSTQRDMMLSEEKIYPDLKDCREIKESHGPVTAVETSHYSSGMMHNSNVTVINKVEKIDGKDGTVLVTVSKKAGDLPEASDSKELSSDIFSKVQEISDKENLASWHYACTDPSIPVDRSMMPLDYSSNSTLNIYYDDSLITGNPRTKRVIGKKACDMGGSEVERAISKMINECVTASGAEADLPEVNPYVAAQNNQVNTPSIPNAFMGMNMAMFAHPGLVQQPPSGQTSHNDSRPAPVSDGPWDCKCGEKGNTGKFCPECGSPRV